MVNLVSYGENLNIARCGIVGLSTDVKPTTSVEGVFIANGSTFVEIDTQRCFLYDKENHRWYGGSGGGGGGGSDDSYTKAEIDDMFTTKLSSKIEFLELNFNGTKVTYKDEAQTFDMIKVMCRSQRHQVRLFYNDVLYLPYFNGNENVQDEQINFVGFEIRDGQIVMKYISVDSSSNVIESSQDILSTANLTTIVDSHSTNAKIPTAKAVFDAITSSQGTITEDVKTEVIDQVEEQIENKVNVSDYITNDMIDSIIVF